MHHLGLLPYTQSHRNHFQILASWDTKELSPFRKSKRCWCLWLGCYSLFNLFPPLTNVLPFSSKRLRPVSSHFVAFGCNFRRADLLSVLYKIIHWLLHSLSWGWAHVPSGLLLASVLSLFHALSASGKCLCLCMHTEETPVWYFCSIYREIRSCYPIDL